MAPHFISCLFISRFLKRILTDSDPRVLLLSSISLPFLYPFLLSRSFSFSFPLSFLPPFFFSCILFFLCLTSVFSVGNICWRSDGHLLIFVSECFTPEAWMSTPGSLDMLDGFCRIITPGSCTPPGFCRVTTPLLASYHPWLGELSPFLYLECCVTLIFVELSPPVLLSRLLALGLFGELSPWFWWTVILPVEMT